LKIENATNYKGKEGDSKSASIARQFNFVVAKKKKTSTTYGKENYSKVKNSKKPCYKKNPRERTLA